ncbi:winged helix-turn-helix transcriptional regulator [Streptomyces sp. NBC_01236]|uniref:winged helix-turn-helix transcriptional regulator n=1 Tax=Streptomyces sp. NBC_01236 TaxID=2903789 RepID=UPI003FA394B3
MRRDARTGPALLRVDRFVERASCPEAPPRVECSLTLLGRSLVEHLFPVFLSVSRAASPCGPGPVSRSERVC